MKASLIQHLAHTAHFSKLRNQKDSLPVSGKPGSPQLCPSSLEKHLAPPIHSRVMPQCCQGPVCSHASTMSGTSVLAWGQGVPLSGGVQDQKVLDLKRPHAKGWLAKLAWILGQVQTGWRCPMLFLSRHI